MFDTVTIHPNAVYSTDSLCAILDVSPHTLADARRTGELRSARKGRRVIYLGAWVLSWLRQSAGATHAP